ncbi:MAG: hypothetical protein Fur0034_13910 [Desulfuromonadia bacterium]
MNCRCPKCSATIQFDKTEITDRGLSVSCPSCRASLVIVSEPFSCRAIRKSGGLVCSQCGATLESDPFCHTCGTPFPPYFLAEEARLHRQRIKRLSETKPLFSGLSFQISLKRPFSAQKTVSGTGLTLESSGKLPGKGLQNERSSAGITVRPRRMVTTIIASLLILVAAGGGYYLYHQREKEKEFISLSMKALYRVKGGKDLAAEACQKLLASYQSTGRMKLSPDEETRIRKAGEEIDRTVAALSPPKGVYQPVVEQLKKMNQAGARYRKLALTPPPTGAELTDETKKLEGEFSDAAQGFKKVMPETMHSAFGDAKRVYRPLQNF